MFKKIKNFYEDVKIEMSKVSWPTFDELTNSTMIVTVVSILFTIFIFFADSILSKIMKFFINL